MVGFGMQVGLGEIDDMLIEYGYMQVADCYTRVEDEYMHAENGQNEAEKVEIEVVEKVEIEAEKDGKQDEIEDVVKLEVEATDVPEIDEEVQQM